MPATIVADRWRQKYFVGQSPVDVPTVRNAKERPGAPSLSPYDSRSLYRAACQDEIQGSNHSRGVQYMGPSFCTWVGLGPGGKYLGWVGSTHGSRPHPGNEGFRTE